MITGSNRQLFLAAITLIFISTSSIILERAPQLQAAVQEEGQALQQQNPVQDGTANCINDGRRPGKYGDKYYPDKAHTNCPCWGRPDKQKPGCKPKGEDPKCTNHCKYHMCDCDTHCPS